MREVGRIRRPFQAQAITVVMLEHFNSLDAYVLLLRVETIASDLDIFSRAFEKTLLTLRDATKSVTELRDFDMKGFDKHPMVKAFGDAEALIGDSFKSLQVCLLPYIILRSWRRTFPTQLDTEWSKRRTELLAAVKKDEERLTKLHDIISRVSIRYHSSRTF